MADQSEPVAGGNRDIRDHSGPDNVTTRACSVCGNQYLILLRTLNLKFCSDCNTDIPWHLGDGQKPLV